MGTVNIIMVVRREGNKHPQDIPIRGIKLGCHHLECRGGGEGGEPLNQAPNAQTLKSPGPCQGLTW